MRLSKPELEKNVFEKFSKHAFVNIRSFESCNPPKPDIFCKTEMGAFYFELTDNTSDQIQKSVHKKDASRSKAYWFDPFPETYRQKFTKQYETNSIAIDLIIYFGIQPITGLGPHFEVLLRQNIEWIEQNIERSVFF